MPYTLVPVPCFSNRSAQIPRPWVRAFELVSLTNEDQNGSVIWIVLVIGHHASEKCMSCFHGPRSLRLPSSKIAKFLSLFLFLTTLSEEKTLF